MRLVIYHLYPDLLDLYGDRGNILALSARCRWRGIEVDIRRVTLGDPIDFSQADILFLGGGSDREQSLLVEDLGSRAKELADSIEDGLVILTICGGYQLLGQYYQTGEGKKIPGLKILDLYTIAGSKRLIGNVVAEMNEEVFSLNTLVGFENHSGKTYLGPGLQPLAKIIRGYGNNGEDKQEGVRYKNVLGTYLHGPLLPKNPHIADWMILSALKRKGLGDSLALLDDTMEINAHRAIIARFKE
ncbi:MAG: glutamine amidotransferase [Peptococcaceae bacterium]|nr:glutamine amidotransferase [Peptococcaceae bacterium]